MSIAVAVLCERLIARRWDTRAESIMSAKIECPTFPQAIDLVHLAYSAPRGHQNPPILIDPGYNHSPTRLTVLIGPIILDVRRKRTRAVSSASGLDKERLALEMVSIRF